MTTFKFTDSLNVCSHIMQFTNELDCRGQKMAVTERKGVGTVSIPKRFTH